jgi:hypothetical protein
LILICLIIQFNNNFSDQYALAKVYYDEDSKDNDDEDDEDSKDNDDEDDEDSKDNDDEDDED